MNKPTISISKAITYGRKHFGKLIYYFVANIISLLFGFLVIEKGSTAIARYIIDPLLVALRAYAPGVIVQAIEYILLALILLVPIFLFALFYVGIFGIFLDVIDKQSVDIFSVYKRKHLALKAAVGCVLYTTITILGYFLFIIPGIIFSTKYGFWIFELIDNNCGIWEAFQKSAQTTYGNKWDLYGFYLIKWQVNSIAFIFLFIPYLITAPIFILAQAYMYRKLQQKNEVLSSTT